MKYVPLVWYLYFTDLRLKILLLRPFSLCTLSHFILNPSDTVSITWDIWQIRQKCRYKQKRIWIWCMPLMWIHSSLYASVRFLTDPSPPWMHTYLMDGAKSFSPQEFSIYYLEKDLDLYMDILWTTITLSYSSYSSYSSYFTWTFLENWSIRIHDG